MFSHLNSTGCRFVGDVVCNPELDPYGFNVCVLSNESKNLWTKLSMTIKPKECCEGSGCTKVLSSFCNNNDRIIPAAGLTKPLDEPFLYESLKRDYSFWLQPCIVLAGDASTLAI